MLLDPILPERSLAMLYAPRGVGKTLLALSIGLAVASGSPLLRWNAPRQRRVLYVDGEMPLISLQERLRAISTGLDAVVPNDGFRVLAADSTESGLSIGSTEGQIALDPLLTHVDLVIIDNLSTLCTNGSESASDAWVPMQNWLLKLRRRVLPSCWYITRVTARALTSAGRFSPLGPRGIRLSSAPSPVTLVVIRGAGDCLWARPNGHEHATESDVVDGARSQQRGALAGC
jgi:hypothetical protein